MQQLPGTAQSATALFVIHTVLILRAGKCGFTPQYAEVGFILRMYAFRLITAHFLYDT